MNTTSSRLYETDFYGWVQQQAGVLRAGSFASLDLDNLIEEIEDMGKNRQRALESRLEILLMHLLKWNFQSTHRSKSWEYTIKEQRDRLADHLLENPSLKPKIPEAQAKAYRYAVKAASQETGIAASTFPQRCPWTYEQITDPDFWPDA